MDKEPLSTEQKYKNALERLKSRKNKTEFNPFVATFRIIGLYLLMGFSWIVLSDFVINLFTDDPAMIAQIQLVKGWFYVLVTAIIFYFIIKRRIDLYKETIDEIYFAYQNLDEAFGQLQELEFELRKQFEISESTKEALMTSDQRYELAVEGSNDGIWDWDIVTGSYFFSKNWMKSFGYQEKDLESTFEAWKSLLHPEDAERAIAKHQDHFEKKSKAIYENIFRLRRKDGTYRWILSRGKARYNPDGKPIRMAGSHTDITEKTEMEKELIRLAYSDTLTELPNRTKLEELVNKYIEEHKDESSRLAFVYLDIDDFKHINDTKGHATGDVLLQQMADLFTKHIPSPHLVSRLGGDEFAIVYIDVESKQEVMDFLDGVLHYLHKPWNLDGQDFYISASFGVAMYPQHGGDFKTLLQNADAAMYHSKSNGKNQIQFFTAAIRDHNLYHIQMLQEIRQAIDNQEFKLYYQPVVDTKTHNIIGVEALIRWVHPEKGFISPMEFIPFAEQTGYIYQIDEWVFQNVFHQKAHWGNNGLASTKISINLSPLSLKQEGLMLKLQDIIERNMVEAKDITIEITETAVMEDLERSIIVLNKIKALGVSIALDDFGTGYSSLTNLQKLPIDTLKIDRDFIKDITNAQEASYIIKSIIDLAHHLGLKVVAEGVETKEQLSLLKQHGCDYAQGYYFYHPEPSEEVTKHLSKHLKKLSLNLLEKGVLS